MSPEMEAAYDGDGFTEWAALKIVFADKTLRLMDRSQDLMIGGDLFVGADDDYGAWVTADEITDGMDSEAPRFQFGLAIPDPLVAQSMLDPARQMSRVEVMTGLVDPVSGLALPGWETEFVGYFDMAVRHVSRGEDGDPDLVECDCISVFEHLMENAEGVRLNGAWHKARHPGELGLDHIIDVEKALPWGTGGANSGFSGKARKDGPWWTEGFSPLTKAATRAQGGFGYLTNPFIMTGQNLKWTRGARDG